MSYRDEVLGIHVNDDVCAYTMRSHAAEIAARADARIAELEQSVTVRDTEIARLETDLEVARRDAARYRWLRDESGNDHHTPWCAVGYSDPTWLTGEHLDAAIDEARAGNGESCDAV